MSGKSWAELEETTSVAGIKFMFFVFRVLGRKVFALFLFPVISYFFIVNKRARRASFGYIDRLRNQKVISSSRPVWWLSLRHFMNFGGGLLDKLGVWSGAIKIDPLVYDGGGRESLLATSEQGQGMILVTCHLGNVEASRVVADSHRRVPMNILVHTKHAEKFNRVLNGVEADSGLNLLQVTDISPATALQFNEKIQQGEAIVIAGDRTPLNGEGRQSVVDFLGAPAAFPQGPFILASLLKCPVYFLACVRHEKGFKIVIEHMAERIHISRKNRDTELAQWVQLYAQRLERYVQDYPLQWFNFYDFWSASQSADQADSTSDIKNTSL